MLVTGHIPNEKINLPLLEEKNIALFIKRLDQIHPLVSGNKFFKLKYNLLEAKKSGAKQILTFGGAFSNHIYATAAAANEVGIEAIGIIRGEKILPLNPTLTFAKSKGMRLHYLDRTKYRVKNSPEVFAELENNFGPFYLIPEGGTNALAIKGSAEILEEGDEQFDAIAVPVGTGGTFTGLLSAISKNQNLMGFSALKGDFIYQEIEKLRQSHNILSVGKYSIYDQYHFGGYARYNLNLLDFIQDFFAKTDIALDPVYTGKMMFGLLDLIQNNNFKKGSKILAIHTGGLQGNIGFNQQHNTNLPF